jgi:hypothetical protein
MWRVLVMDCVMCMVGSNLSVSLVTSFAVHVDALGGVKSAKVFAFVSNV